MILWGEVLRSQCRSVTKSGHTMDGTFRNLCLMNPKLANSQENIIVKLAGILKMLVTSSVCVVKRRTVAFVSISCGEKSCHSLKQMCCKYT